MPTIFFATDVHGSEVCWRKFLNAASFYGADVLVLGGDMTGKAMVPIVERGGGRYELTLDERPQVLNGEDELRAMERRIADRGLYPARVEPEHAEKLSEDEELVDALFKERMLETASRWMEIAAEKLGSDGVRCFVCPGNDDVFEIDEVISDSEEVEICEGRVIDVDGFSLASSGWTNHTPWETHRETSEEELAQRIESIVAEVPDPERAIFNLHAPPYDTGLDDAPALDDEMRPIRGGQSLEPVGSTAVRAVIEERQPLLSLHGHVHESRAAVRLGRTLSVNPGSAYDEGVLQGALIKLDPKKKKIRKYVLLEG